MSRDDLIRLVGRHPGGLTTLEVAALLAQPAPTVATVGSRLSHLADYGFIAREYEPHPNPRVRRQCRWLPR